MPPGQLKKPQKKSKEINQESAPDFVSENIPAPKIKKNKSLELKRRLADIYSEVQKDTRMEKPKKRSRFSRFLILTTLFLFFLAAISWAGFFLFGQGTKFSEENIQIKINGPEKTYISEDLTYKIIYKNAGRLPLGKSSFSLRYPDGFQFISAKPSSANPDNREWDLGTLNPNQEGSIEISGQIFAPADSDLTLRTFFNYRPANFNADFQKITNFTTHLDPLPVDLSILGPEEITAGEEAKFSLTAFNSSEKIINNLEFGFSLPVGLKITAINPTEFNENNVWKISSLAPKTSNLLEFSLLVTSETSSGDQSLKINFLTRQNEQIFNQKILEKILRISKSDLLLQVAANGSTEKQSINFSDKINFSIAYENIGNASLKNVSIKLILDTPSVDNKSLFDWANIEDKADGTITGEQKMPQLRRGVITWTKSQIPALAEIKPKDKGSIELLLPIKPKASFDFTKLTDYKTTIYSEALIGKTTDKNSTGIQSNNLIFILNSDLNLSLQATFKESKDLPPVIGKSKYDTKSIYALTWNVTNSWHEVTDLQITATLPENVDWENASSTTAGDIFYDATTKQITWKLNRLPVGVNKAVISFDAGIKSKNSESGQEATLIEKARVEAKDKVTGENLLFWKDPIVTVL